MSYLGKGGNALLHDHQFSLAVEDFLDCDGPCGSSINDAFIILYLNKHTILVEHRPMFTDDGIYLLLEGGV